MYMYGGPLENIQHLYFYGRSLIKDHLFGSMDVVEGCDYDYTMIDNSSAQGGNKKKYSVGVDNSNIYTNIVIEIDLMESKLKMINMKIRSCKVSFDMP
jgi:hypothetical protein